MASHSLGTILVPFALAAAFMWHEMFVVQHISPGKGVTVPAGGGEDLAHFIVVARTPAVTS